MYVLYLSGTGFQHMCETVFAGLCQIVGASELVTLRRQLKDFKELVDRLITNNEGFIPLESGSRK